VGWELLAIALIANVLQPASGFWFLLVPGALLSRLTTESVLSPEVARDLEPDRVRAAGVGRQAEVDQGRNDLETHVPDGAAQHRIA
jgi:hypothetical protein